MGGGDGRIEVVAGALQGGCGGFEVGGGGVPGEGGQFHGPLGFELLGEEILRSGVVQQGGLRCDLCPGDALFRAVDGLRLGEFLLGDLGGEGLDAALGEVAAAFDGFALGAEVVEEVGIVVLNFGDEFPLLHALAFDDVQVLHAAGDLGFHIDAPV